MCVALRPERDVELVEGRCMAASADPWLALDPSLVPVLAGRLIELTYRASYWDEPVRPVLRFWSADGSRVDRIATGPIAGAGIWIGRVPRGTSRISISPTNRPGRFDFRIERLRTRAWLALLMKGARENSKSARSMLLTRLIGWRPESDVNLAWALGGVPLTDYAGWRKARARPIDLDGIDGPRFDWAAMAPMQVVVIDGDPEKRAATIASLHAQVFPYWTTTIFGVDAIPSSNARVTVLTAGTTRASSPDTIVTVLAAGDVLVPEALAYVAEQAHRYPACQLFYGDALHHNTPELRPGWSPRLFASRPVLEGPLFVRGLPSWPDEVQVGFVTTGRLQTPFVTTLAASKVRPLRRILLATDDAPVERRNAEAPLAPLPLAGRGKGWGSCRASASTVKRPATPTPAPPRKGEGRRDERFDLKPSHSSVAIIIPTRDHPALLRRAVASIRARTGQRPVQIVIVDNGSTTDDAKALLAGLARAPDVNVLHHGGPFNFSMMCNQAAAATSEDVLVFFNDDTEVLAPDWLDRLVAHALAPDIGAVGARLTYPDGRLQHVGVLAGMGGSAGHFGARDPATAAGWAGRNEVLHEVSAVTGACLAVSRPKFEAVGGFDAVHLPVELGDVDLCFRLNARGWQTVIDPAVHLMHEESASRGGATFRRLDVYESQRALFTERWRHVLRDDPVFHPGLSLYSWTAALG